MDVQSELYLQNRNNDIFTNYFIGLSIVSYLFIYFFLMILDKIQYLKREIEYQ